MSMMMVRDVGNYTSNLDLSSPPDADREVQDPVRDLLQKIRETPPVDNPSDDSPGGDSSASLEQGSPRRSGGGSASDGSSGISASGAVSLDVALAVASRHVVDVVNAVAAVALHLVVGVVVLRRNVLLPDRLHKHLTPGPSANYDV